MDVYNRGYNEVINALVEIGQVRNTNLAFKLSDVAQTFDAEAVAAGYYAVAYK